MEKLNNKSDTGEKLLKKSAGLIFVGVFFLGMAGGFIFDNIQAGVFAGLGFGFLSMAITYLLGRRS
jgi:hypothetical protein